MLEREILELAEEFNLGTPGIESSHNEGDRLVLFARHIQANTLKRILPLSAGKGVESFRQEILGLIASTEADIDRLTPQPELHRIAWELERTALNDSFYGNALRAAKDIPGVTDEERALLDRYATGQQTSTDHIALQTLAMKIEKME